MAEPLEDLDLPPGIVPLDTPFSRLPLAERARRRQAWLDRLREREPIDLGISGAELVAEGRREEEYWPSDT